jgi:hypothetical protein
MNSIEVYENEEFWKAYNHLYWYNKSNPEMINGAEKIARLLESDKDKPLYVLSLGLGTGTLELPFLAKIQEITQRKVRVVGIDQSGLALRVTTRQLSAGLDCLPTETEEMIERIDLASREDRYDSKFWTIGEHFLQLDDLDFEPSSNRLFKSFPSNWLTRLKENMANDFPPNGFDILISSFCLFHLDWWQHTLIMALSQLKKGGLFLHSHMDGDEHILEGRSAPQVEEIRRKDLGVTHNPSVLKKTFDAFFNHQEVKAYLTKPRFASAAVPFGILDTLQHFESKGLERLPDIKYLIPSKCTKENYLSLLQSRGFSTFRLIENAIGGKEPYNKLLEEIRKLDDENETDNLLFDLVWTVYRVDTDKLLDAPLIQKFLKLGRKSNSIPVDYEYEMKEAIRYSPSVRQRLIVEDGNLAEYLIKQLSVSGLFNSACIGGDVGFVKDSSSPMQYWGFINPLYKSKAVIASSEQAVFEEFVSRIALYLMLIDTNYANQTIGKSLMKQILPYSFTPVAVSYKIDSKVGDENFTASVRLENHSNFKQLHFDITVPHNIATKLRFISKDLIHRILEDINLDEHTWIFKQPKVNKYKADLQELTDIIEYRHVETIKGKLLESIDKLGGVEPIFIDKLKEVISNSDSERIFHVIVWLGILSPQNYILIVPATYYIKDKPVADNLFVLVYDSQEDIGENLFLQKQEIAHEVCKINLLYSQQGISMGAEAAEKRGRSGMLHQLPKDLAATNERLSKFITDYEKIREIHHEMNLPHIDLSSLDGLNVSVMFAKCDSERILYELPSDCAEILEGDWTPESINRFIRRVVWLQSRRKCLSILDVKKKLDTLEIKPNKPQLIIEHPFKLQNADGLYPLMIIVLRNAYEHSWRHSIFNTEVEPQVRISYLYEDNSKETIIVENTGEKASPQAQKGMHVDIETFSGLTGGWTVRGSKSGMSYCEYIQSRRMWRTEIYRNLKS